MTAAVPAPAYTLHDADPHGVRDTVLAIWRNNLSHEQGGPDAKYDWYYLGKPEAPPLVQLMRHEASGDWVGVCAAGRCRMQLDGRELRGGVIVDFAVLPEHRSLGPALTLQQGLIASGARQLDLLYGFPNPKAVAAIKRAGCEKLTDIVGYGRALRHAGYLTRRMPAPLAGMLGPLVDLAQDSRDWFRRWSSPRVKSEWVEQADPRMDALWQESARAGSVLMVRDAAFARWRFDSAPQGRTRYLLVHGADGRLAAWFATRVDAGALRVLDFWSVEGIGGVRRECVDALLQAARSAGHAAVTVEIAAPEASLGGWRSCGFFEIGRNPVYGRWSSPGTGAGDAALFLTSADKDG